MSYESPITMITEQVVNGLMQEEEKAVMKAVWRTGVEVDKDELIRALNYDRGQYDKGYADGKRDAMKWFSAYNESPPIGTKVFVLDDKGRCGIGLLDTELDWWDQATGVLYAGTITHWLPIPPEVEK